MEKYKYFKTQFDNMSNQGDTEEKLRVELSSEMAKEIVKGIENTDEQAIFIFYPNQMFVRVSDPYKARVVELNISCDNFISYHYNVSKEDISDEQVRVGIVISRLKDITKTLKKGQSLILVYREGSNKLETKAGILNRDIRLIRSELLNEIPIISIAPEYEAKIDYTTMQQFIKASNGKGHLFDIITDGRLVLASETDEGSVRISKDLEESFLNPADYMSMTTFSVEHLDRALSLGCGDLNLRGKQDSAVEFSWTSKAGINMKSWVAPRV